MNKRTTSQVFSMRQSFFRYYGYVAGKNALKDI